MTENSGRTVSGVKWVRAYIAKWLDMVQKRTCQKKEYAALIQMYQLSTEAEERQFSDVNSNWSFYDEEYTWEELFSKRAQTELLLILKKWLREAVNELSKTQDAAERNIKRHLCQAVWDYERDEKHGPGFVYSFLNDLYLPEITKKREILKDRLKKAREQEREIRDELKEYHRLAANARRFGGEREDRLDEYIDAMENYRIHMFKINQDEAILKLLELLFKTSRELKEDIKEILDEMELYVENYQDSEKELMTSAWDFPDFRKDFLEQLHKEKFASCIEKMENNILECQKAQVDEWAQKEEENNNKENNNKENNKEKNEESESDMTVSLQLKWDWIRKLIFYRVLEIKDETAFEIHLTGEVSVLPEKPSPAEALMHMQRIVDEEKVVSTISFSVSGGIGDIWDYITENEELCRKCEAEIEKRKQREEQYQKLVCLFP